MAAAAGALRSGAGAEPALIMSLPDEVLALLFRFLDPKTLLMVVPAVSARGGRQRGNAHSPRSARGCALGLRPLQECGWLAGGTFV